MSVVSLFTQFIRKTELVLFFKVPSVTSCWWHSHSQLPPDTKAYLLVLWREISQPNDQQGEALHTMSRSKGGSERIQKGVKHPVPLSQFWGPNETSDRIICSKTEWEKRHSLTPDSSYWVYTKKQVSTQTLWPSIPPFRDGSYQLADQILALQDLLSLTKNGSLPWEASCLYIQGGYSPAPFCLALHCKQSRPQAGQLLATWW